MTDKRMSPVILEDVTIMFKNFSGRAGQYNREGDRNFVAVLPEDIATQMMEDGWNVRHLDPKEEGDSPLYYISVAVRFNNYPPRVVMITSRGKTNIGEGEINLLDLAMIESADLIIRPYEWEVNGKRGVKAYLKSLYVTIQEDELEQKYIDVPDSAASSMCTPGVDCPEDLED